MGMVDDVTRGRDLLIREVRVRYHNADSWSPQFTDRAVRSLVRLFNVDEVNWQADLDIVAKVCRETDLSLEIPDILEATTAACMSRDIDQPVLPCACCCDSHHRYCMLAEGSATPMPQGAYHMHSTCTELPRLLYPEEDTVLDCGGHHLDIEEHQDGFLSAALQLGASMEL